MAYSPECVEEKFSEVRLGQTRRLEDVTDEQTTRINYQIEQDCLGCRVRQALPSTLRARHDAPIVQLRR